MNWRHTFFSYEPAGDIILHTLLMNNLNISSISNRCKFCSLLFETHLEGRLNEK